MSRDIRNFLKAMEEIAIRIHNDGQKKKKKKEAINSTSN